MEHRRKSSPKRPRIRKRGPRKRCDARVKNLVKVCKNGVAILRTPRCRAWALANGRCRLHGGVSTGPRTPEGKARVVAAMVEGRRKWIERLHAEGKRAPGGRKLGSKRPTEQQRAIAAERALRVIESREWNRARAEGRDLLAAERERAQAERRAINQECLDCLAEIDEAAAVAHGWIPPSDRRGIG